MENYFKDIVNIGIGVVETAQISFYDTISKLENIYNDLSMQSSYDDSEFALKAREAANQVSGHLDEIKKNSDEFFEKASTRLNNIINNMKDISNNPVISELVEKVENLNNLR
jgi:gas vesicle protein